MRSDADSPPPVGDEGGTAPTVRDGLAARARRWQSLLAVSIPTGTTSPVETPEDVRRHKELQSTRHFIVIIGALVVAVAVAFPFLRGDAEATVALAFGYAIGLFGTVRTAWRLRRPERYTDGDAAVFATTCVVGGACSIYYFGFFSPAPIATAIGIFYFSLSCAYPVALYAYLSGAGLQGLAMVAISAGWIEDHGVIQIAPTETVNIVVMVLLIELVLFLTFYIGRATAIAMSNAVAALHHKTREVALRDALLQEARRELDQALKVGGPGRFSEQRLGSFELGVLVGRGAMSDVYQAVHADTGQPAAVKLLHRDVLSNPQHVRRFLREVRIAAALDLPNVVRVLEVGGDDAPVPYLAMELLHGEDLAQLLRERRVLEGPEVIEMLRQVARGIDAAHGAGVVHRDIKPQNLFRHRLDGSGQEWKVLDFGVSRVLDGSSSLTDGHAVGTPSYMAPEQARGRDVDGRADVFSLGVIAYRALTGRPAFTGPEIPHILHEVVFGMPPRPSEVARLPPAVDHVLAIALAKRPEDRFDTAGQLAELLEEALMGVADPDLELRAERLTAKLPWGKRSASD
jgi:serine/threonine-protein kinase